MTQNQQKILLIAVSTVLAAILQMFAENFIYIRTEMWSQPWRFLTAHWVHVGWIHYLLNLTAFICFLFIFPKIRISFLLFLMSVIPILMSLVFYFVYPQLAAYAGFSGVLHGLYAVAAMISLKYAQERLFAGLFLFGLSGKLLWEATVGELSVTADLIGHPILVEAHQWGVILSIVVWLIILLINIIFFYKSFRFTTTSL